MCIGLFSMEGEDRERQEEGVLKEGARADSVWCRRGRYGGGGCTGGGGGRNFESRPDLLPHRRTYGTSWVGWGFEC